MKHFRLFSLFFGCWLLASCTADPGTEPGPFGENPPTAEKPHAVPVEQALEELQSVLEEIDIPAEDGAVTRSGGIRRVKNVTTVSPEVLSPGGTRSEATADVEDLLYIVNFENEAGYAILGADDRLEPVYAVVDEGSLTTEEFRYAVTIPMNRHKPTENSFSRCNWLHRLRSSESKTPIQMLMEESHL